MFLKVFVLFSKPIPFQVIFVAVECVWFFLTLSGGFFLFSFFFVVF